MFYKRRQNKSGTVSVFVLKSERIEGKKHPVPRLVKSFGSSKDPKEIEKLVKKAKKFIKENEYIPFMRINNEKEIESCETQTTGFLHFYEKIFEKYFKEDEILKSLAIMRIAEPASKLHTSKIAKKYGINNLTKNKIYKYMDKLVPKKIEELKKEIFENTKNLLEKENIQILFYDLTTIYFENNTETELKKKGFSKDGKSQHVQITMALAVTEKGLPITYEIFKGNISENKTLIPVLTKIKQTLEIKEATIIADAALMSKMNMETIEEIGFKYIISARIKNMSEEIIEQIVQTENYKNFNEYITYKNIKLDEKNLVVCKSKKRYKKDEYDLALSLEKLKDHIGKNVKTKLSGQLRKPYVKLSNNSAIMIDENKLEKTKRLFGFFGFITNCNLSPKQIIQMYRGLWQVERTFRITKHNLAIRPVYHYTDRRIKAHFAICFLALALMRTAEYLLGKNEMNMSPQELNMFLRNIKTTQISSKGQQFKIVSAVPNKFNLMCKILSIPKIKKFSIKKL